MLRRLLARDTMLVAPGADNGLTARMIEQAGFEAVYMTGRVPPLRGGSPTLGS